MGRRLHCHRPESVFEEDEAEEAAEKKIKNLNCPQKGAKGDAVYIVNALKVFLKRIKQKRPLKVHK